MSKQTIEQRIEEYKNRRTGLIYDLDLANKLEFKLETQRLYNDKKWIATIIDMLEEIQKEQTAGAKIPTQANCKDTYENISLPLDHA